jgi:methionyl-tRNA formyltransferase
MTSFVVATTKPWNLEAYARFVVGAKGDWHLISHPDGLTKEVIERIAPRYVFFPHWSWKVPPDIFNSVECVLFHMTDLPFGRGGSPLQNLIVRGETHTKVTALRMTNEIDAGPVYLKRPLSLDGSAEEIFRRVSVAVFEMIDEIVANQPVPVAQIGTPTFFSRRTPSQSILPEVKSARELYDHIRMLDVETYPPAFLDFGGWRIEFSGAELSGDEIRARVVFRPRGTTE